MQQQRREDRMPQGWVRRAPPAATSVNGAESDSPAEGDIKILFEDVSSDSSGEFDIIKNSISRS
jgi:hypothetical protein